jgi:hypothetical protein
MSELPTRVSPDEREELLSHLQRLDNQAFEEFLGELWEQRGWETEVTPRAKDWGIDVVATRDLPIPLTLVIQAKRYGTSRNVSSTEVQQYSSLRRQRENVDAVTIITTAGFSDQARETAKALNVKLLDGTGLCRLIEDTEAYKLVNTYIEGSIKIPDTTSNRKDPLDDVAYGKWSHSDLENHVLEGYGLSDTVPVDFYGSNEIVQVIHSCSDSPIGVQDSESKKLDIHTDTAEGSLPVHLHLTSKGIWIFARDHGGDIQSFTPYGSVEDVYSDSALFGPSESITFNFSDGKSLKYKFESMSVEVRDAIERVLGEKVNTRLRL